ncbi:MAG: hypothetical protein WBC40_07620 [Halobacteriota archaeon]
MKIKAFAEKRKVLILGTVFAIAIVSIIAILMVKQPNEARERVENTENELPVEIKLEIERLIELGVTRWSVDRTKKRINIFVYELTPEREQFNGNVISGWTINVTYDAEYRKEEEKLNAELERLKEKPAMEIGGWVYGIDDPRIGNKRVDIFVGNLTPENQQLHGKMIDGWEVYVWKSQVPPERNETGK